MIEIKSQVAILDGLNAGRKTVAGEPKQSIQPLETGILGLGRYAAEYIWRGGSRSIV